MLGAALVYAAFCVAATAPSTAPPLPGAGLVIVDIKPVAIEVVRAYDCVAVSAAATTLISYAFVFAGSVAVRAICRTGATITVTVARLAVI